MTSFFDPEKIIRYAKGKQNSSTTASDPSTTVQSKYVPEEKVLKSALKSEQISISSKNSVELSNQTLNRKDILMKQVL